MESVGITPELLSGKLVGINTDGAAVNHGTQGGVVKLLINSVNEQLGEDKKCDDYLTVVHCIAHNLELTVCDVKKRVGYLDEFERVIIGIFQQYYYLPENCTR